MAFLESPRFPSDISYGSSGGPAYLTNITSLAGGGEARNARWSEPLHRFDVGFGVRTQAQLETLLAFFHAVGGRRDSFRFKDFADYKSSSATSSPAATDQALGTGDAATVDFQLVKTYTTGALSQTRTIKKPVSGTVLVALDGVLQGSGWTVNTATGIVTFSVAPGAGVAVSAGFEFDTPARFDTDSLVSTWEAWQIMTQINVPVVEVRL